MYWGAFLSVFADAVTDTPLGDHTVRHTRDLRRSELRDAQGRTVAHWTDVDRRQGVVQAQAWLEAQALSAGHNPLHDDRYYAQRQGLA